MIDKFEELLNIFNEIEEKLIDPEVISDQATYQSLIKRHADLKDGIDLFKIYKSRLSEILSVQEMLEDDELKEMAKQELQLLKDEQDKTEESLKLFLIPKDPDDTKNVHIEIRSGTGGDEAALFASELFRMYCKYAEKKQWKIETLSENITELGGIKEIEFAIVGKKVFSHLKFESGTHRVQRVPETESSGRLHTSAATVSILPEAEDVDIQIDTKDLRVDTFRASGAGGQHVNKTSSAIRITHIPTNTVVSCQDQRSQFQNKDKAMRILRTKLYEKDREDRLKEEASLRKIQVGSGDRSQKIRTYNFPQNRLTDHRINLSLYSLQDILNGELDEVINQLIQAENYEKLKEL